MCRVWRWKLWNGDLNKLNETRKVPPKAIWIVRFMLQNTVVNPVPQEYVTKTTRYKNIYRFFCLENERNEKIASNILSCARFQHIKRLRRAKVIDTHLFCLFLWVFEQCTKRETRERLEHKKKCWSDTSSILRSSVVLAAWFSEQINLIHRAKEKCVKKSRPQSARVWVEKS